MHEPTALIQSCLIPFQFLETTTFAPGLYDMERTKIRPVIHTTHSFLPVFEIGVLNVSKANFSRLTFHFPTETLSTTLLNSQEQRLESFFPIDTC